MSQQNENTGSSGQLQDATLGPVGNVHIQGGKYGQLLASDGAGGLQFVNRPLSENVVINWNHAHGDPTQNNSYGYGRLQGQGSWTGIDSPNSNALTKGVRLTWNYSNVTGTLSWWYPLKTSDWFSITVVHRTIKATVEGKEYPQGDGITIYAGSSVDGFWKTNDNAGLAVTCDEWGTDADKYWSSIGSTPRSVNWMHSYETMPDGGTSPASVLGLVPVNSWNLYNKDTSKYFWEWTETKMIWNPYNYTMVLEQNGKFVAARKVSSPFFRGGWVGVHAYNGANMAYHDIRRFQLAIYNNPYASPVGPYPKAGEEGYSVAHLEPGVVAQPACVQQRASLSQQPAKRWWPF